MALLIRPLQRDDTPRVVELYTQIHAGDPSVGTVSAEQWNHFLHQPVNSAGEGFRVAEESSAVVGLASSSLRTTERETVRHFRILVDPAYRRQRIGSRLLAAVAAMDVELSGVLLQSLCPAEWGPGRMFLEKWGFELVETEWQMRCEQSPKVLASEPNVTCEFASDAALHSAEVARLHNLAYADDVSFVPYTSESMASTLSQGAQLWLLRQFGQVIGYAHVEPDSQNHWLESLVVDPRHQGRGLGTYLGSVVLSELGTGQGKLAFLQVSDRNPAAMRVYQRLGFEQIGASHRLRARREVVNQELRASGR